MTKEKFLALLKTLNGDTNFVVLIIQTLFEDLPPTVAWSLAHNLYLKYYWDGPLYKVISNLNKKEHLFSSYEDCANYLKQLGYDATASKVASAFQRRSTSYCNHTFINDETKEITYYE